jgi:hypothetical protein
MCDFLLDGCGRIQAAARIAVASRISAAVARGWETEMACEAPGTSMVRRAPARRAMYRWRAAGMLRSSSPNTNQDGRSRRAGCAEGLLRDRPLRDGHLGGLHRRHVRGELGVEAVDADPKVGRAVAPRDGLQRRAERAAREHPGQGDAALAGRGREPGDVDEADDVAGIGVDVRDHRAPVRVPDEHDRPVDRSDQVADGGGVRREPAQGVGGGDHGVTRAVQGLDDAVPARRLGEGAVDENDRGGHDRFLRVGRR